MILLNATTKSLEIKLGGAVTTNELTFVASYVDINQSTFAVSAMAEGDGVSTGSTAVTVVTAPGATTSRLLKNLSIQNTDTVSATVTVQYNNNGTKRPIIVQALTTGQSLIYDEANGWTIACSVGSGGSSLPDPVTVAHGGTGDTTLTNHGVLLGQGTAAIVATAVGTTNTVLHGNTGADPTYSAVVEGDLSTSDITTANVSSAKHGFAPKLPNDATKFLDGTGAYSTPAGVSGIVGFRLTLASGAPVPTTDQTAKTTLYCSPFGINARWITLYDSSNNPTTVNSAEFSIPVPATTNTVYSVFAYLSSGVATLELAAWTNDTTPGTAAYSISTAIGQYIKTGDPTRLFLGLIRTTGSSGQAEDSYAKRWCANYYNRVRREMKVVAMTNANYSTPTFRQINANAANQLDVLICAAEETLTSFGCARINCTANDYGQMGIGVNSTTTSHADCLQQITFVPAFIAVEYGIPYAHLDVVLSAGRNFLVLLQYAAGNGTMTWAGAGISGTIMM